MGDQGEGVLDAAANDRLARFGCFACAVVQGRPLLPDPQIVYEDDDVIAFLNHFPTQEGHTLVFPRRHLERFERDLTSDEWMHLQLVVQRVAKAVADATGAIRMYIASLGSPERYAHLHMHVCPCPAGTPFELQRFAAMTHEVGVHHLAPPDRQRLVAHSRAPAGLGAAGQHGRVAGGAEGRGGDAAARLGRCGWIGRKGLRR